jgi:hypothetical protein
MRLFAAAALVAAAALAAPVAAAQDATATRILLAQSNMDCCIKVCGSRGGRIGLCPQWCNDQLLQNPKKNFCPGGAKKKQG